MREGEEIDHLLGMLAKQVRPQDSVGASSTLKKAQGFANPPPSAIQPAISAKPTATLASIGCTVTSPHFSALNDLRQDGLDAIDGDGEPDAIGRRVELWINSRQRRNADHVALQVYQCPSTVARVNRCIGLNRILDGGSALPSIHLT